MSSCCNCLSSHSSWSKRTDRISRWDRRDPSCSMKHRMDIHSKLILINFKEFSCTLETQSSVSHNPFSPDSAGSMIKPHHRCPPTLVVFVHRWDSDSEQPRETWVTILYSNGPLEMSFRFVRVILAQGHANFLCIVPIWLDVPKVLILSTDDQNHPEFNVRRNLFMWVRCAELTNFLTPWTGKWCGWC